MNYKKKIKRIAFRFGTISPFKAANKIVCKLESYSVKRYGSDFYEVAYNYYLAAFKKYRLKSVLIGSLAILCTAGLYFNILIIPAVILSTLSAYFIRRVKNADND